MSDPRSAPSILTRGAVDLSGLRASAAPADAAPAVPADGTSIVDVTEQTFQQDVLQRSLSQPVIVEFDRAGSHQAALAKLAQEGGGAWTLARVDIESSPRLAQMFRIQTIPTVYAVIGGQPVDGFNGELPEPQLRQWVAAVLQAGSSAAEVPADPRYDAADEAMIGGDLDAAEQAYKRILAESPADPVAEAGLAQVGLLRRVSGVDALAVVAAADADPDDVAKQLLAADVEAITGAPEKAYARLIDLVRRTAGHERDSVRAHLISLFTVAGPDDPAVAVARRNLASALF